MYFFAIIKNSKTGNAYIPCGDSKLVVVDDKNSLHNQYEIAAEHLRKRFTSTELLGIACYKRISDKFAISSVKFTEVGSLDTGNLAAFSISLKSVFY